MAKKIQAYGMVTSETGAPEPFAVGLATLNERGYEYATHHGYFATEAEATAKAEELNAKLGWTVKEGFDIMLTSMFPDGRHGPSVERVMRKLLDEKDAEIAELKLGPVKLLSLLDLRLLDAIRHVPRKTKDGMEHALSIVREWQRRMGSRQCPYCGEKTCDHMKTPTAPGTPSTKPGRRFRVGDRRLEMVTGPIPGAVPGDKCPRHEWHFDDCAECYRCGAVAKVIGDYEHGELVLREEV